MFPLAAILATGVPAPVLAQRLPFERTFELSEPAILDVSTIRGKEDRCERRRSRPRRHHRRRDHSHRLGCTRERRRPRALGCLIILPLNVTEALSGCVRPLVLRNDGP